MVIRRERIPGWIGASVATARENVGNVSKHEVFFFEESSGWSNAIVD